MAIIANIFRYKRVKEEPALRIKALKILKDLNKKQIKPWIEPIPEKDRYNNETTYKYFKAVAFQKKAE